VGAHVPGSLSIWTASSRVGAMISARGLGPSTGPRRSSREKIVIKNAAVLPVPVCDWAAMSRPWSASGSTLACTGVHSV
jgi:hypothetical protein